MSRLDLIFDAFCFAKKKKIDSKNLKSSLLDRCASLIKRIFKKVMPKSDMINKIMLQKVFFSLMLLKVS